MSNLVAIHPALRLQTLLSAELIRIGSEAPATRTWAADDDQQSRFEHAVARELSGDLDD